MWETLTCKKNESMLNQHYFKFIVFSSAKISLILILNKYNKNDHKLYN